MMKRMHLCLIISTRTRQSSLNLFHSSFPFSSYSSSQPSEDEEQQDPSTPAPPLSKKGGPLTKFLIRQCGFTIPELKSIRQQNPQIFKMKTFKTATDTVNIFSKSGLSQSQIKSVVLDSPLLLTINTNDVLRPKLKLLRSIGFKRDSMPKVICRAHRSLFRENFATTVEYLRGVYKDDVNFVKAVRKFPQLLQCDTKTVEKKLSILKEHGIKEREIMSMLVRNPRTLYVSADALRQRIAFIEELGIKKKSQPFTVMLISLIGSSLEKARDKMQGLEGIGFNDTQVKDIVKRYPQVLTKSIESVNKNVDYLTNNSELSLASIAKYPIILGFNLEQRIKPRLLLFKAIVETADPQDVPNLPLLLVMSNEKLLKKYGESHYEVPDEQEYASEDQEQENFGVQSVHDLSDYESEEQGVKQEVSQYDSEGEEVEYEEEPKRSKQWGGGENRFRLNSDYYSEDDEVEYEGKSRDKGRLEKKFRFKSEYDEVELEEKSKHNGRHEKKFKLEEAESIDQGLPQYGYEDEQLEHEEKSRKSKHKGRHVKKFKLEDAESIEQRMPEFGPEDEEFEHEENSDDKKFHLKSRYESEGEQEAEYGEKSKYKDHHEKKFKLKSRYESEDEEAEHDEKSKKSKDKGRREKKFKWEEESIEQEMPEFETETEEVEHEEKPDTSKHKSLHDKKVQLKEVKFYEQELSVFESEDEGVQYVERPNKSKYKGHNEEKFKLKNEKYNGRGLHVEEERRSKSGSEKKKGPKKENPEDTKRSRR